MYEFSIETVDDQGDKVVVTGRCLQGPFEIGDHFTSAYRFANVTEEDLRHVGETPVSLRADRIVAYRRDLPDLYPGMTATIDLAGEGGKILAQGWTLGGSKPSGPGGR